MKHRIDFLDTYHRGPYTVDEIEAMERPLAKFVSVNCYVNQVGSYVNTFDDMGYALQTAFGWIGGDGAPFMTLVFENVSGRMKA